MKKETEDYIKKQCEKEATKLVDILYDHKLLNPKLKREDFRTIEKLLVLNNKYQITSSIKGQELLDSITGI